MSSCVSTSGLVQRLQYLLGVLAFSCVSVLQAANAAPVAVSVDHRVTVSYSAVRYDARKGVYSSRVRIKNRSGETLHSPLRLTFDQAALKEIRLLNAHGDGKGGHPYFEFALPKGKLPANGVTKPLEVMFAVEKDKRAARAALSRRVLSALAASQRASAGAEFALLEPRAEPYALPADGSRKTVRFSVRLAGEGKPPSTIYLRRRGDDKRIAMNDRGKDGDLVAQDGILGARVQIDTSKVKPDSCLSYEAFVQKGQAKLVSPPLRLCVSSFPVRMAESDTTAPITFPDGINAVSDEILVRFTPGASAAAIRAMLAEIGASVSGSLLPDNLYQARLAAPVGPERMTALISKLKSRPEVAKAYPNALGGPAAAPNDPQYSSQHGLQRIRASDVWDIGATGSGVIVAVLDTGIDRSHPDFGTIAGGCQLATNDCGSSNTDFDAANGHGTAVAGVIAAKANNSLGVAGVAPASKIKSIRVGTDTTYTLAEIYQSLVDARTYGLASVINASLSIPAFPFDAPPPTLDVGDLCASINSAAFNGVTPVAIVVNAAGNNGSNGNYYPGRCNDSTHALHAQLSHKELFITVANSISILPATAECSNAAALDQRCGGTTIGVDKTSNYGPWVDMRAPGMSILTTRSSAIGGGYAGYTGTSFSAPMVSGAAAILKSCGVPLGQIESSLTGGGVSVPLPFPDGSNPPRLDVYGALSKRNTAPSGAGLSGSTLNENIDTSGGVAVGTLSATDVDTCDKHTFSIVSGGASFSIDPATNTLRLKPGIVLNYEVQPSYAVTVRVTDFFGKTYDKPLTVTVNNLNEAPTAINLSAASLDENNAAGATVATLTATDPDASASNFADPFAYALVAGTGDAGNGSFTITGNALKINGAADFEAKNSYSIRVRVTDKGGQSFEAVKTIAVNNVNEAPTAISLSAASLDENNAAGATVATLTATDPDASASNFADPFAYELVAGTGDAGNDSFTITGNALKINDAADFEARSSYSIRVRVTDKGGQSFEAVKTIAVNNVNEVPTAVTLTPAAASTPENGGGIKVADIAVTDDAPGTNTLSLSGTDAGDFLIVGNELHFKGNADYEAKASYSVTVEVDDASVGATPDATQDFTLSIADVNEAPTAVSLSNTVNSTPENGGSTKVADIAVSDDALGTNSLTLSGADAGDFQIIGNELHFNGGANFEAKSSYSVTVSVDDTSVGGTPDATQDFTLSITDVNEAPAATLTPAAASTPENGGSIKVADIAVSDDVPGTNTLTLSGADAGDFLIVGNELHFKGNADYEAKAGYSVTVEVDDASVGATPDATQDFTLSIADVNEAPTAISLSATSLDENNAAGATVATLTATDPDASASNFADPFAFALAAGDGDTGNGEFTITGNALKINGAADYEARSSYSIRIRVTDNGGQFFEAIQTIGVNNANDPPHMFAASFSIDENSAFGTSPGTVTSTDPDAGDTLSYSITAGNTGNAFAIDAATGEIRVNNATALDFETTPVFSLTVTVTDNGMPSPLSDSATVTIALNDLSEAIPSPILVYDRKETGTDALGNTVDRYYFRVSNWNAYPPEMFAPSPTLPPCGLNTSASRTWVDFYRTSDNSRIYGFCALGTPANLNRIWFGVVPAGGTPPASVYIKLNDRQVPIEYKSNDVTIP